MGLNNHPDLAFLGVFSHIHYRNGPQVADDSQYVY